MVLQIHTTQGNRSSSVFVSNGRSVDSKMHGHTGTPSHSVNVCIERQQRLHTIASAVREKKTN